MDSITLFTQVSFRFFAKSYLSPAGGSSFATIVNYTETKTAAEPRVDLCYYPHGRSTLGLAAILDSE